MTIYLNNVAVLQPFDLMADYISSLCGIICGGQSYSLIDVATNTVVASDLAILKSISSDPHI